MSELQHRIKVFVYRFEAASPHYLLLKPDQGIEALWGPLQDELGFGEKLDAAIRRRVHEQMGLDPTGKLMDLEMPGRWTLGDEEIVEWTFGFRAEGRLRKELVDEAWAAHRWAKFQDAYYSMGLQPDREAAMRLHTRVLAA